MKPVMRPVRVEGRDKVTGRARYVDDLRPFELGWDVDVAVPVTSTRASGRVAAIDVDAALAVPGVGHVMTARNGPRLRRVLSVSMAEVGQLLPLQDDRIHYHGQCVAVVVADTLDAAREGARRVVVHYSDETDGTAGPVVALADAGARILPVRRAGIAAGRLAHGDAHGDHDSCEVRVDAVFHAAPHHHNAIEPSAVIARWDDDGGVTVHAAVQWPHIDALAIGQAFGLGRASGTTGFLARALLAPGSGGRSG